MRMISGASFSVSALLTELVARVASVAGCILVLAGSHTEPPPFTVIITSLGNKVICIIDVN